MIIGGIDMLSRLAVRWHRKNNDADRRVIFAARINGSKGDSAVVSQCSTPRIDRTGSLPH
jgi:hypothetical protein